MVFRKDERTVETYENKIRRIHIDNNWSDANSYWK